MCTVGVGWPTGPAYLTLITFRNQRGPKAWQRSAASRLEAAGITAFSQLAGSLQMRAEVQNAPEPQMPHTHAPTKPIVDMLWHPQGNTNEPGTKHCLLSSSDEDCVQTARAAITHAGQRPASVLCALKPSSLWSTKRRRHTCRSTSGRHFAPIRIPLAPAPQAPEPPGRRGSPSDCRRPRQTREARRPQRTRCPGAGCCCPPAGSRCRSGCAARPALAESCRIERPRWCLGPPGPWSSGQPPPCNDGCNTSSN